MSKTYVLPAIPVRGVVPFPVTESRIEVGREISMNAVEVVEEKYGGKVVILLQKNPLNEEVDPEHLYSIGMLADMSVRLRLSNNNYKLKVNYLRRVKIKKYVSTSPYLLVEYEDAEPIYGDRDRELTLLKMIAERLPKAGIVDGATDILAQIKKGVSSAELIDLVAEKLNLPYEKRIKYVVELDVNERLLHIIEDFDFEKRIQDIEDKINSAVKKSIDESQKEYYLREKMKAIQNELGDKARKEEDIDRMRNLIKNAKMPEHIEKKALVELQRFTDTPPQMAESQILKNYLDFLIGLPWSVMSEDNDDLESVSNALNENHYGLTKVKDRILEYLAVKVMTKRNPQTILCLVGPPGVGKTSLAVSIASALGRKFIKQSLGGVKDESEIRGHRRTYIGALPGRIVKGMFDAKTINPVFLLDEIDKMASDYKGDPASAMLEVLDPEQNKQFSDHYLEESYDLSQVLFITTANYLENVPAPLRDRMEIVELSSYTEFEKFNIAKKHLIEKAMQIHGITEEQFTIEDEALYFIIRRYTREAGVRELYRYINTLIRKTIKEILVAKKISSLHVTIANIEQYLGRPKFTHNLAHKQDEVGFVTGLAYTAFGGDTLNFEATYYPGKGGLVLTGKLGDVMKESAQAALSFIRSHAAYFGIEHKLFEENDIHIHVPEGAVPKDGPSAGVTMATAMISCLTNTPIRKDLGMTGEITLRGEVLAIGGLREKAIAAMRSGLKVILIPNDNENDISDIPEEVKEKLTIICVDNIIDVYKNAVVKTELK